MTRIRVRRVHLGNRKLKYDEQRQIINDVIKTCRAPVTATQVRAVIDAYNKATYRRFIKHGMVILGKFGRLSMDGKPRAANEEYGPPLTKNEGTVTFSFRASKFLLSDLASLRPAFQAVIDETLGYFEARFSGLQRDAIAKAFMRDSGITPKKLFWSIMSNGYIVDPEFARQIKAVASKCPLQQRTPQ